MTYLYLPKFQVSTIKTKIHYMQYAKIYQTKHLQKLPRPFNIQYCMLIYAVVLHFFQQKALYAFSNVTCLILDMTKQQEDAVAPVRSNLGLQHWQGYN